MATTKEQNELHKTIWKIANDLRGAVDGWTFKAYVLGTMFYRYISENLTDYANNMMAQAGVEGFDYAQLSDDEAESAREDMVGEKGFFILPSQLFCNVCKNLSKIEYLNETLNNNFRAIEASAKGTPSEGDVEGLFSDFLVDNIQIGKSVKQRNELLAKVLLAVRDMELSKENYGDLKNDAFGDAYEFLMGMYASSAGKNGGEFFTPQEVSEVLARIAMHDNPSVRRVYDPACGSGSLLLKFKKVMADRKDMEFFGQEINPTTFNLCRINMFLHNVNYDHFDIQLGDTLLNPRHPQGHYDAIVSNPPYSTKWIGKEDPILINDERYAPAGVLAPQGYSDMAFVMHILYNLGESGTAAIVEFPGVLYRDKAEQKIRKYLVDNNYIDTVIQLPGNLFYGVGIATCIIVMRKGKRPDSNVLFINAEKLCTKEGNKNKLRPEDQDRIVSLYQNREEVQYFTALKSHEDIVANDYNLSVSSYVEQEDTREVIDIDALNDELEDVVAKVNDLRNKVGAITTKAGMRAKQESEKHGRKLFEGLAARKQSQMLA